MGGHRHEAGAGGRWRLDRPAALAIAGGGALGAAARWAVLAATDPLPSFPWPVLVVNVVGCALLGTVLAGEQDHPTARLLLHDFAGIGFCGGLTTFSTFAVEVAQLSRAGRPALAAGYLAASVVGGLVALVAGAAALRHVRALLLPLEEEW